MKKNIVKVLLTIFLLPLTTLAAVDPLGSLEEAGGKTSLVTNLTPTQIISRLINVLLGLVASIFIVLIVLAGFRWMTSAGNTDAIKKAKETITNSVIGLGIIFLSYVITYTIFNVLLNGTIGGGGAAGHPVP